ncbi:protein NDR1-like [Eucalyptus grandis]|uniref:protein NDR1-like n=1 Tax=Eucalyptus grandis TaxID=71139 RepID=UPI00192EC578|nr:protein NDR1-like [Eucalyptus grandis]
MSKSAWCCSSCGCVILILGLTAACLWNPPPVSMPRCSIQLFYLPALDRSLDTPTNTTIFLDIKLRNGNGARGIQYDPVNLTVSCYSDANQTKWLKTIPGFYQGYGKKATKHASVETLGVNWTDVVAKNESLVFRVDLAAAMRFKTVVSKTKKSKLMVGANVTLNDEGAKNTKKGIDLKSGVGKNLGGCYSWQMGISVVALVLILLD